MAKYMETTVTMTQVAKGLKQDIINRILNDQELIGIVAKEIGISIRRSEERIKENDERMTQFSCLTRIANYLGVARIEDLLEEGEGK